MDPIRLLYIGDRQPFAATAELEESAGLTVTVAGVKAALNGALTGYVDVVLASFPILGWRSDQLLDRLMQADSSIPVIIQDPNAGNSEAARLCTLGAFQCVGPAVAPATLFAHVRAAAELRRASGPRTLPPARSTPGIIGDSPAMSEVIQLVELIGPRRSTVLITGETGTGKEVVARALHASGPRALKPMVAMNCSAIPESLLEAELFGHVKGAFTGAVVSRTGRFEQADKGTLFLDEIADMPVELQAKLLRVLQEREFQRLGSSEVIRVDVRVIAATNVDLQERVRKGNFREDLFYRLNVVPIHIPPLRERVADIPALVTHFVEKICRTEGVVPKRIGLGVYERLCNYFWPGNVRQLENAVERAVILSGDRPVLYARDFALPSSALGKQDLETGTPTFSLPETGLDFEAMVNSYEQTLLEAALRRAGGNKTLAADLLGMKRTTFLAKAKTIQAKRESPALLSA